MGFRMYFVIFLLSTFLLVAKSFTQHTVSLTPAHICRRSQCPALATALHFPYSSRLNNIRDPNNNKNSNSNDDGDTGSPSLEDKVNQFLDTPFFYPDEEAQQQSAEDKDGKPSIRLWFANLVQEDYELAETLYAGLFLSFMVWISQELLRMQIYGNDYVPFHSGGRYGGHF